VVRSRGQGTNGYARFLRSRNNPERRFEQLKKTISSILKPGAAIKISRAASNERGRTIKAKEFALRQGLQAFIKEDPLWLDKFPGKNLVHGSHRLGYGDL
jgi:hypothetical protein